MEPEDRYERATFAAGCFWDVEAAFRHVDGVVETVAGYTGGSLPDPSYEDVDLGTTGHVQAVGIVFDPARVSYDSLLEIFFSLHDPSRLDGQGDYTGPQYRSMIFYHTQGQKTSAVQARHRLMAGEPYRGRQIFTEIVPAVQLWPAEESHQQFYEKCGQCFGASRQIVE